MNKTCSKCGRAKSALHFATDLASPDCLSPVCRSCMAAYKVRTNYHERYWKDRRDYRRQLVRNAQQTSKGKARQYIRNGVYTGRIAKPSHCEMCGEHVPDPRDLLAHHPDYERPHEVIWVCRRCHGILESVSGEVDRVLSQDPEPAEEPWEGDFVYPISQYIAKWRQAGVLESEFFEMLRVFRRALADDGEADGA